jgi:hypothetical protein
MRELVLVVLCSAAAACRPEPAGDGKPVTPETADTRAPDSVKPPTDAPAKPDPCGAAALGLGAARALDPWTLPSGCTPTGSSGKTIARSDAELAAIVQCPAGVATGVDFSKQAVLAIGYTLSPAGVGLGAFDDGKLVTLVSRQRSPCPDDPRPMPMNTTAWFVLPGGGERTFADTICTVESTCK